MQPLRALIVLPTYQEAENIAEVLRRVRAAAPRADVLVIDDSSPDGTADIARAMDLELGGVSVICRPAKLGLGSAYREGFRLGRELGYEALVEMDSDLSHEPSDVPRLLGSLDAAADLVIGSRYVPGGSVPDLALAPSYTLVLRQPLRRLHASTPRAGCHRRFSRLPGGRSRPNRHRLGPDRGLWVPGRDDAPGDGGGGHHRRGSDPVRRPPPGHLEDVCADRHRSPDPGYMVGPQEAPSREAPRLTHSARSQQLTRNPLRPSFSTASAASSSPEQVTTRQ